MSLDCTSYQRQAHQTTYSQSGRPHRCLVCVRIDLPTSRHTTQYIRAFECSAEQRNVEQHTGHGGSQDNIVCVALCVYNVCVHNVCIQCTPSLYTVCQSVCTMCVQCMCTMCIYNVHQVYTVCQSVWRAGQTRDHRPAGRSAGPSLPSPRTRSHLPLLSTVQRSWKAWFIFSSSVEHWRIPSVDAGRLPRMKALKLWRTLIVIMTSGKTISIWVSTDWFTESLVCLLFTLQPKQLFIYLFVCLTLVWWEGMLWEVEGEGDWVRCTPAATNNRLQLMKHVWACLMGVCGGGQGGRGRRQPLIAPLLRQRFSWHRAQKSFSSSVH